MIIIIQIKIVDLLKRFSVDLDIESLRRAALATWNVPSEETADSHLGWTANSRSESEMVGDPWKWRSISMVLSSDHGTVRSVSVPLPCMSLAGYFNLENSYSNPLNFNSWNILVISMSNNEIIKFMNQIRIIITNK